MSSYLIVATYNHQAYKQFVAWDDAHGTQKRRRARQEAIELFLDEGAQLSDYFVFADSFKYYPIPWKRDGGTGYGYGDTGAPDGDDLVLEENTAQMLREQMLGSQPYGWVGIVPDKAALDKLMAKINWPDGPFCCIFDIRVIELEGSQVLPPSSDSAETWQARGDAIYKYQTPKMWDD